MDGNRLTYVSNGKLSVFDYDDTNQHTLMNASPNYAPAFAPDYKNVYVLTPGTTSGSFDLAQTSLLSSADH
jgi:hypothetical protein